MGEDQSCGHNFAFEPSPRGLLYEMSCKCHGSDDAKVGRTTKALCLAAVLCGSLAVMVMGKGDNLLAHFDWICQVHKEASYVFVCSIDRLDREGAGVLASPSIRLVENRFMVGSSILKLRLFTFSL